LYLLSEHDDGMSGMGRRLDVWSEGADRCPRGEIVKYMIMLAGSQRDYEAMSGKPALGKPTWTPEDFARWGRS